MRLSRFWFLMEEEFGSGYAHVLAGSLVLSDYQKTALQALDAGVSPRDVWEAVCDQQDVPASRRLGRDLPPKR
ncbi:MULTISPECIES: DUF3046 domain-containing protein [Actinomycetes]|uniref:DUF3046 domain-containing protein n=2 Tax=Actinomycetes TaxID=1760 RepID=A0ABP6LNQ7_9MICC|nr:MULTISPECIES: DUF3046 domain-containing protein [unclassified Nesterenkonia]MDS2171385.1 DUF3046 domain-containing protein [Nesterenkonia sp. CL21]OSM44433.1 histidine kinase [Nesterenkonia sp. PF2B19]